ncbi:AAA family ATPase [Enterobacter hormaechei subsp. hoffmannii]|uniref:ATP-binding protein n=1 Tax=Enterobacter hormaechei TaxID=158836 RepID=UPI001BDF95C2|nr:AAA family ATPase [Enterobacter hormaechei]MBT2055843.1 AAA family ATPase [Enterobacter hormaechei subsp. hoffmannii]
MKIAQLKLMNFRGYQNVTVDFSDDFNVVIGKNDIGKSTILEAMEIFFNNEVVKIDIDDCNVFSDDKTMSIQISFIPEKLSYTIDTIPTNFKDEYLLDRNGWLTIKKSWDCSKGKLSASSLKTSMISNYPVNFPTPLVNLKITELRKLLTDEYASILNVDTVKKNTSSQIRLAIYNSTENLVLDEIPIDIDKEDGKKIWGALQIDLPLFFLFQSDRENRDSDKEVQSPLRTITRTAIAELEDELEQVKAKIINKAIQIGNDTIDKLHEMSPEIANVLNPVMTNKAWDSLFSFSFSCDDGIPVNKRGSGVRRLILLNYFRAEAERKTSGNRNVIYAIEEPETSQHPEWQRKLFEALMDLPKNEKTQVIVTTHSPSLASLAPIDKIIFIKKDNGVVNVQTRNTVALEEVVTTLGVLSDIPPEASNPSLKVVLCLEGPTDVEFFDNICSIFDVDINRDPRIMSLSLGGGTLKHWVNKNYLRKLNVSEVHIYDRDVSKYAETVNEVNSRGNSWAVQTLMWELENYIHPSLYTKAYPIQGQFIDMSVDWKTTWPDKNIPTELSAFLKAEKNSGNQLIMNEGSSSIKNVFSSTLSQHMDEALFRDLNAYDEVNGWFDKIKSYL